jgi:hypothetical protein
MLEFKRLARKQGGFLIHGVLEQWSNGVMEKTIRKK